MAAKKIVVIDDQDTARLILQGILSTAGHQVVAQAAKISESLQVIQDKQPDLIFCDIQLKDEDGVDLLEQVRAQFPNIYVIMITGEATKENLYRVVEGGAHAFVAKPVNAKNILGAISRCDEYQKTLKETGVKIERPGPEKIKPPAKKDKDADTSNDTDEPKQDAG